VSDSQNEQAPQERYERFETTAEFLAALDRLLAEDGRELRIFDPDLVALRFEAPGRIERLRAFLAVSRTRRVYIAVHDTDYLTKYSPRTMHLLAQFAHAIQVQRTHQEIRNVQDAFMVLDARHYVRRPVAHFSRGAIGLNDETEALAMLGRFQEIWSASYPAVAPTTLGL